MRTASPSPFLLSWGNGGTPLFFFNLAVLSNVEIRERGVSYKKKSRKREKERGYHSRHDATEWRQQFRGGWFWRRPGQFLFWLLFFRVFCGKLKVGEGEKGRAREARRRRGGSNCELVSCCCFCCCCCGPFVLCFGPCCLLLGMAGRR